jgi:CBS domain-containing protein
MIESVHLHSLLGQHMVSDGGDRLGRLEDVIVRLRGDDYPLVTGVVGRLGNLRVFLPASQVRELTPHKVVLSSTETDLRPFERRPGEVLLREDILGHRLIDVEDGRLVRAADLELEPTDEGLELKAVDTRARSRVLHRVMPRSGHDARDWKLFEPLLGHEPSAGVRAPFRRLRRLKPAQLADLLEQASREEGGEILDEVHADPELEADVFEELDVDTANRFFSDMSDGEIAKVIERMNSDDAADAVSELPQERRGAVLDLLQPATRGRVLTLLGYNPGTAGGLMGVEFVAVLRGTTASEALGKLASAPSAQSQVLTTVYVLDEAGRLLGSVTVVELLAAPATATVDGLADPRTVRVGVGSDLADLAILMADYNLVAIPVVDEADHLLGVVTVDDVLEAVIPEEWRRRQPSPRPERPHTVSP